MRRPTPGERQVVFWNVAVLHAVCSVLLVQGRIPAAGCVTLLILYLTKVLLENEF